MKITESDGVWDDLVFEDHVFDGLAQLVDPLARRNNRFFGWKLNYTGLLRMKPAKKVFYNIPS